MTARIAWNWVEGVALAIAVVALCFGRQEQATFMWVVACYALLNQRNARR